MDLCGAEITSIYIVGLTVNMHTAIHYLLSIIHLKYSQDLARL